MFNSTPFTKVGPSSTWFGNGSGTLNNESKKIMSFCSDSRAVIFYQSITFQPDYKNYSNEELRLQDYMSNRIFGENPHVFSLRPNNGTRIYPFAEVEKADTFDNEAIVHQSCVAMPQYIGYSQEELRLEDYRRGNSFYGNNHVPTQLDNVFSSFNASTSTFGSASRPCYEINLNFGATPSFFTFGDIPGCGNKFPGICLNVFGPGSMPNYNNPDSSVPQGATGGIQINIFGTGISTHNFKSSSFDSGKPSAPRFGSLSSGLEQSFNSGSDFVSKGFGHNLNLDSGTSNNGFTQAFTPIFGAASPTFRSKYDSGFATSNLGFEKNSNKPERFSIPAFGKNLVFGSNQIATSKSAFPSTLSGNVTDSRNDFLKSPMSGFGTSGTKLGQVCNSSANSTSFEYRQLSDTRFGSNLNPGLKKPTFNQSENAEPSGLTTSFSKTDGLVVKPSFSGPGSNANTEIKFSPSESNQLSTKLESGCGQISPPGMMTTSDAKLQSQLRTSQNSKPSEALIYLQSANAAIQARKLVTPPPLTKLQNERSTTLLEASKNNQNLTNDDKKSVFKLELKEEFLARLNMEKSPRNSHLVSDRPSFSGGSSAEGQVDLTKPHTPTRIQSAFTNLSNESGFLSSSKNNGTSNSVGFGFKSSNSDDSKIPDNTNTTLKFGVSNTKLFGPDSCLKPINTNAKFNSGDSNSKTKSFNSFKTSSSVDVTLESKDITSKEPVFGFSKKDDKTNTASKFGGSKTKPSGFGFSSRDATPESKDIASKEPISGFSKKDNTANTTSKFGLFNTKPSGFGFSSSFANSNDSLTPEQLARRQAAIASYKTPSKNTESSIFGSSNSNITLKSGSNTGKFFL